MKPELADFGLTEDDVRLYKKMMAVYIPKEREQLQRDKSYNDAQMTKGIGLIVVFWLVLGILGSIEAMANGFPIITLLLLICPPIIVAIFLKQESITGFLKMLFLPGMWIVMLLGQHTRETVADRVPKSQYVDPALDEKMSAYIDAENRYNWEHNLPLIVPTANQWGDTLSKIS